VACAARLRAVATAAPPVCASATVHPRGPAGAGAALHAVPRSPPPPQPQSPLPGQRMPVPRRRGVGPPRSGRQQGRVDAPGCSTLPGPRAPRASRRALRTRSRVLWPPRPPLPCGAARGRGFWMPNCNRSSHALGGFPWCWRAQRGPLRRGGCCGCGPCRAAHVRPAAAAAAVAGMGTGAAVPDAGEKGRRRGAGPPGNRCARVAQPRWRVPPSNGAQPFKTLLPSWQHISKAGSSGAEGFKSRQMGAARRAVTRSPPPSPALRPAAAAPTPRAPSAWCPPQQPPRTAAPLAPRRRKRRRCRGSGSGAPGPTGGAGRPGGGGGREDGGGGRGREGRVSGGCRGGARPLAEAAPGPPNACASPPASAAAAAATPPAPGRAARRPRLLAARCPPGAPRSCGRGPPGSPAAGPCTWCAGPPGCRRRVRMRVGAVAVMQTRSAWAARRCAPRSSCSHPPSPCGGHLLPRHVLQPRARPAPAPTSGPCPGRAPAAAQSPHR
jgi:translation initiation factor IF-2